uniref:Uncharacterized protein n=1 Tax=Romanomermis culicivorax TaxID=13658 RepID=A0A915HXA0_ROMCU
MHSSTPTIIYLSLRSPLIFILGALAVRQDFKTIYFADSSIFLKFWKLSAIKQKKPIDSDRVEKNLRTDMNKDTLISQFE